MKWWWCTDDTTHTPHTCAYIHTNIRMPAHMHARTHTHTYTYIHTHRHTYTCAHTYTDIHTHTHTHTLTHTHTHTCTHSNTHTRALTHTQQTLFEHCVWQPESMLRMWVHFGGETPCHPPIPHREPQVAQLDWEAEWTEGRLKEERDSQTHHSWGWTPQKKDWFENHWTLSALSWKREIGCGLETGSYQMKLTVDHQCLFPWWFHTQEKCLSAPCCSVEQGPLGHMECCCGPVHKTNMQLIYSTNTALY